MLAQYQERYGYRLIVLEKIRYENHIISSTYTKKILGTGNMDLVGRLLGYSYGICGTVEHGHKLGRTLGFPTMNLAPKEKKILPKYGVYACYGNHDVSEKILAGFTFDRAGEKKESDPRMDSFLERAGIRLLKEEWELIDGSFYLYGRPDQERPGRGVEVRKLSLIHI